MALYEWSGSSWVLSPQNKIWNGSSWVEVKGAKVWNGSAWKEFLNCSITTGSSGYYNPGGKGTEYYSTTVSGYSVGLADQPLYGSFGSYEGSVLGTEPLGVYWSTTVYEVSPQAWGFKVRLPGDTTGFGSKSVMLDGSTIIYPAKAGYYDSGNDNTYYEWFSVNGDTIPTTTPFGSDGEVHNVQLV